MKLKISIAIFAAAVSCASLAQAQAPAAAAAAPARPTVKPSPQATKAINELDAAVRANDRANIPAKIAAAQAVATTTGDRYLVGHLRLQAAIAAADDAAMITAVDEVAASGYQTSGEVAELYDALGGSLYKDKQYAQAATAFQKALALNPARSDSLMSLGEAQLAAGQSAAAAATLQKAISATAAAGQKPSEQLYKRAISVAYNAKLPQAVDLGRDWVAAYPSPDSWRNAVGIYRNLDHPDAEGVIDLLRLLDATGALTEPSDYAVYISAALDQMNFNEAHKVYDAGIANGKIDVSKPQFAEIRDVLKVKTKATAADLDEAIKMSPAPAFLLRIGDRFYAMGDTARAVQVYRDVLAKPGADRDLANLHLGMALARSGDKAGAAAALKAVTGPRADIAKYWLLYTQQKS